MVLGLWKDRDPDFCLDEHNNDEPPGPLGLLLLSSCVWESTRTEIDLGRGAPLGPRVPNCT